MSAPNDGPEGSKAKGERIAKVIARSGLCSRRDAEVLIGEKRVSVNGVIIESAALAVSQADKVLVDGRLISSRKAPRLWRYYKPKGRVTTHKDPEGRPTVFDALPEDLPRLISIGRLDFNTEGLLLLTNDGELARHLELPSTGWTRRYRVRAYGKIGQTRLDELRDGVTVAKVNYGPIDAALEREQGDNVWITLSIREGKNREVRRIMEHLGLTVNRLIRVSFGPFMLGDLEPGQIEEVKTSILKDQLGARLSRQLGVRREPMREDRSLAPARSKPTYLRRKPGPKLPPERTTEAPAIKRRRVLPIDGSEAPKIEYVKEKMPRTRRFGRGAEGDENTRREGRGHPRDVSRRGAADDGGRFSRGAVDSKGRHGDNPKGRETGERDRGPREFRRVPPGAVGHGHEEKKREWGPRREDRGDHRKPQSGARSQWREKKGGDRPGTAAWKKDAPGGSQLLRRLGSEQPDRPDFRRDPDRARGPSGHRKPPEGQERSRSRFHSANYKQRPPRGEGRGSGGQGGTTRSRQTNFAGGERSIKPRNDHHDKRGADATGPGKRAGRSPGARPPRGARGEPELFSRRGKPRSQRPRSQRSQRTPDEDKDKP
jgi:23S rRNA pseudouridine2605 synthase